MKNLNTKLKSFIKKTKFQTLFLLLVFTLILLKNTDFFKNSYHIVNKNYNLRLQQNAYDFCEDSGSGFIFKIKDKFELKKIPQIENYHRSPNQNWIFENYNGNPKSKWNNKYPKLFDFEWDDKGLLTKFICDGDKTYTFYLLNTKNKEIEDFVYIKSVTSRKYYLKIHKDELVNIKQMFSKFWCN